MNKKPGNRSNGYQPYWTCIAKKSQLWLYTERPNGKALSQMKEMSFIVPENLTGHLPKGISSYLPHSEKPFKMVRRAAFVQQTDHAVKPGLIEYLE
jgi:hypothetical protein